MASKTVTVFGGSGFLGRHLVKRLTGEEWTIRVAVRHPERALFLKPMGDVGQVVPVAGDIKDEEPVAAAVAGSQAVVNLVGILYERGRQSFESVHAAGARRVAEAAREAGVECLVHVSAIGADRRSPSLYARTKAAGEAALAEAFPRATIVRPSVVFGPEDDFFNRFAALARLLPALPLFGGGTMKLQPVYVGDVADGLARILADPGTAGKIYEFGGPQVYRFRDIMEIVLAETGRRRLLLPVPFVVAELQAAVLERLPRPLLTRDQLELLKRDNVVGDEALGLRDLGVEPTAAEVIVPTYLARFRRGGAAAPSSSA